MAFVLEVCRRGEVRHQPFQLRAPCLANRGQDLGGRGAGAEPSHAGVDLQVIAERLAGAAGQMIDLPDLVERMDSRREIVLDEGLALVWEKSAHHQNARLMNAAAAQVRAFIDGAHGQPPGALADQHPGHLGGAMSISIRLDHAADLDAWPHDRSHVAEVSCNLVARNEHVRAKGSGHCFILAACARQSAECARDSGGHRTVCGCVSARRCSVTTCTAPASGLISRPWAAAQIFVNSAPKSTMSDA
jgi:hypothetical protein